MSSLRTSGTKKDFMGFGGGENAEKLQMNLQTFLHNTSSDFYIRLNTLIFPYKSSIIEKLLLFLHNLIMNISKQRR